MEFVVPQFNLFTIIFVLLGLYIMAQGIIQLCTQKVIGKGYEQFTKESVQKFSRPAGILFTIAGLALLASEFIIIGGEGNEKLFHWISLGIAVGAIVALMVVSSKMLKPKNGTKSKQKKQKK